MRGRAELLRERAQVQLPRIEFHLSHVEHSEYNNVGITQHRQGSDAILPQNFHRTVAPEASRNKRSVFVLGTIALHSIGNYEKRITSLEAPGTNSE